MKSTSLRALLLTLGVLLTSCGEDPGGTSGVIGPAGPESPGRSLDLDELDLDYETISGTLQEGQSGAMFAYLKWWPSDCLFALIVPESSMPGGSINFTMKIPTKASYLEHPEELFHKLIIRLAPDGEQFAGPITVIGTWMPWQGRGVPPSPLVYRDGPELKEATVIYLPNVGRYRVMFEVDHFSDWEVGAEED